MHYINITVRNKVAVNPAQDRYVCGNSDFVVLFDFDAEWDAFDVKTARFITEDGTVYDQVFSGKECPVPVIADTYKLMVGVFAGNLSTTTAAYVPCKKSILCGGGVPAAPAEDVYNQIMARLNSLESCCVVTATIGEPYSENYFRCTFDKTGAEVVEAVKGGRNVMCLFSFNGDGVNVLPLVEYKADGHATYMMHTATLTVTIDQNDDTTGSVRIEMAEPFPEVRPTMPIYTARLNVDGKTYTTTCNMTYAEIVACMENGTLGTPVVWRKQIDRLVRVPFTVQRVFLNGHFIDYTSEEGHVLYHNGDDTVAFAENEGA